MTAKKSYLVLFPYSYRVIPDKFLAGYYPRHGLASGEDALGMIEDLRQSMPDFRAASPETSEQREVRSRKKEE